MLLLLLLLFFFFNVVFMFRLLLLLLSYCHYIVVFILSLLLFYVVVIFILLLLLLSCCRYCCFHIAVIVVTSLSLYCCCHIVAIVVLCCFHFHIVAICFHAVAIVVFILLLSLFSFCRYIVVFILSLLLFYVVLIFILLLLLFSCCCYYCFFFFFLLLLFHIYIYILAWHQQEHLMISNEHLPACPATARGVEEKRLHIVSTEQWAPNKNRLKDLELTIHESRQMCLRIDLKDLLYTVELSFACFECHLVFWILDPNRQEPHEAIKLITAMVQRKGNAFHKARQSYPWWDAVCATLPQKLHLRCNVEHVAPHMTNLL